MLYFENWSKALQIMLRQQVFNSIVACDLSLGLMSCHGGHFLIDMIIGR